MNTKPNDGGPAFPTVDANRAEDYGTYGMSLRDAFAMAAIQSGEAFNWRDNDYKPVNGLSVVENSAIFSYEIADAMIKARHGASNG